MLLGYQQQQSQQHDASEPEQRHVCISAQDGFEEIVPGCASSVSESSDCGDSMCESSCFDSGHCQLLTNDASTMTASMFLAQQEGATQTTAADTAVAAADFGCQFSLGNVVGMAEDDSAVEDIAEFINSADETEPVTTYVPCVNASMGCPVHVQRGKHHECRGIRRHLVNNSTDSNVSAEVAKLKLQVEELARVITKYGNLLVDSFDQRSQPGCSVATQSAPMVPSPPPKPAPLMAPSTRHAFKWGSALAKSNLTNSDADSTNYITVHVRWGVQRQVMRNVATDSTIDQLKRTIISTVIFPCIASTCDASMLRNMPSFDLFAGKATDCVRLDECKCVASYMPASIWDGGEITAVLRTRTASLPGCGTHLKDKTGPF